MDEKVAKIVVAAGCEYCEDIKAMDLKHTEIIDADSEEGRELLKDEDKVLVPAAFDNDGRKCEIAFEDDTLIVKCDDKLIIESEDESSILDVVDDRYDLEDGEDESNTIEEPEESDSSFLDDSIEE